MQQYAVLIPELIVLVAALVALFADLLGGDRVAAMVGAAAAAMAAVVVWLVPVPEALFGSMLTFTHGTTTLMLRSGIAGLTSLFLLWVAARGWAGVRAREAVALTLFSTVGSMLLISASDLVTLFLCLELATMPAYVLMGYSAEDKRSLEGALKYFLMSVLTSLVMAYGLSFVFGMNQHTSYSPLQVAGPAWLGVAVSVLVLVGFLSKMTAAPFHYWVPDANEGAPSASVAFVAAISKIAPVYAMVRLLAEVLPTSDGLSRVVMICAVVSIPLGIFAALVQTDVRRMVAYSGISMAGYMMLGVAAATPAGYASAVFLVAVYAVSVLGLMLVVAQEGGTFADIAGLVKRRPVAAWSAVVYLFSIIGFPPMVGFYGKLGVLSAAYRAGYFIPVLIAVLMSVVAGGYAFAVIRAMFTPGEGAPEETGIPAPVDATEYPQAPALAGTVIVVLAGLSLGLGLIAEPLISLLQASLS